MARSRPSSLTAKPNSSKVTPRLRSKTSRWEVALQFTLTAMTTLCMRQRSRSARTLVQASTSTGALEKHMLYKRSLLFIGLVLGSVTASATIFGTVSGLIHDPQHRPVQAAEVTLRAANSAWTKSVTSDAAGEFRFDSVPLGEYAVIVQLTGFASEEQNLILGSGRDARTHFSLKVAQAKETVEVKETSAAVSTESSSATTLVSRREITQTPGADQTNSLSMITNYVP